MPLIKSQTNSLSSIFTGNKFVIPDYQRKYSWESEHRLALWNDIQESMRTPINHYIGTFAFRESVIESTDTNDIFEVIDGQQRLTTLFILLSVLIERLKDQEERKERQHHIVGKPGQLKLIPLGDDALFFEALIFGFDTIDKDILFKKSQLHLFDAKTEFLAHVAAIKNQDGVRSMIRFVLKNIEVLVFNVANEAQAVKMFSIINDRGLDLSYLDKTKSTLMYYSTLYLNEELNQIIHEGFGHIFDAFDHIMLTKQRLGIFQQFNEITLFTQHYFSARKIFKKEWNYKIGAEEIFKSAKRLCEGKKLDTRELKEFIESYVRDFESFACTYSQLFEEIGTCDLYIEPFMFLEFTATLYPLIVRLKEQRKLDDVLWLLQVVEVRVYKLKGTNPRNNMYHLCSRIVEEDLSVADIHNILAEFVDRFMNAYSFKSVLDQAISSNASVKFMVYRYMCQKLTLAAYKELQKEHVFSSSPTFDVREYGFLEEEYNFEKDRLGNMTLLERELNITADNNSPDIKVSNYLESGITMTREIGGLINHYGFNKAAAEHRRQLMIAFLVTEFEIKPIHASGSS